MKRPILKIPKNQGPNMDPKSGMAVVVQCGGTLAKACFPGWKEASTAPKREKRSPNCAHDAPVRRARAPARARLTPTSYGQWRTCFLHFNVQKPPSYNIHKTWRSNAKSRPNSAHDAGVWRARHTGASSAQLGLLYSLLGAFAASLKIAR